jgi:hypothetical protein
MKLNEIVFTFFPFFPASEGKMAKKYYATRWWKLGRSSQMESALSQGAKIN